MPTSTGGDDPGEFHYQNVEYKVWYIQNHSNPKAPIHPISQIYKRELNTEEKIFSKIL
jgi:hypothetical protein